MDCSSLSGLNVSVKVFSGQFIVCVGLDQNIQIIIEMVVSKTINYVVAIVQQLDKLVLTSPCRVFQQRDFLVCTSTKSIDFGIQEQVSSGKIVDNGWFHKLLRV